MSDYNGPVRVMTVKLAREISSQVLENRFGIPKSIVAGAFARQVWEAFLLGASRIHVAQGGYGYED
ncbi:hypothetical protein N8D56_25985 (plasmid) [Devosia sp. A8/3-2]|nr:hypothetical protein N8D56_25985 [Devosia sp. A8/3-2]